MSPLYQQFEQTLAWHCAPSMAGIKAADLVTWLPAAAPAGGFLKELSKYLMILTLFLIGANLSREKLKELGLKPVIHGIVLWLVLATVWGAAIHLGWVHCVK